MTDIEIIKALECCCSPKVNACDDCPFYERCYENNEWLEKEAIDLINRQQAEIERLKAELKEDSRTMKQALVLLDELKQDIANDIETAKAKAVKEFAENLKEKSFYLSFYPDWETWAIEERDIDNLVKEMVGEG